MAGTCSATSDLSPSLRGEATAGEWRASASGDQQGASHWMVGTIGNRKKNTWWLFMGWGRLGLKVMEREREREILWWDCFFLMIYDKISMVFCCGIVLVGNTWGGTPGCILSGLGFMVMKWLYGGLIHQPTTGGPHLVQKNNACPWHDPLDSQTRWGNTPNNYKHCD